jgi:hypothetical protein
LHKGRVFRTFIGWRGNTGAHADINDAKAHGLIHIQFIFPQALGNFIEHADHHLARRIA